MNFTRLPLWQDMPFLWAVTAVVWIGMLLYVVALVRRQRRLQHELSALSKVLNDLQDGGHDGRHDHDDSPD